MAGDIPLIPTADLRAVAGASALFIVPIEIESSGLGLDPERLFRSHPPLEQRLARLSQEGRELGRSIRSEEPLKPLDRREVAQGNPGALLAFFLAAVYSCVVATLWLSDGDPFALAWPMALTWIGGVVLALQAAGRASAGAPGMGFAVGALGLLVGPWLLAIVVFFVVFMLGSDGVGRF